MDNPAPFLSFQINNINLRKDVELMTQPLKEIVFCHIYITLFPIVKCEMGVRVGRVAYSAYRI